MHAHDGRDVRSLQIGEHHVSALDAIGPNFRPVESSRAQPVVSSEVNKTAILLHFLGDLVRLISLATICFADDDAWYVGSSSSKICVRLVAGGRGCYISLPLAPKR